MSPVALAASSTTLTMAVTITVTCMSLAAFCVNAWIIMMITALYGKENHT